MFHGFSVLRLVLLSTSAVILGALPWAGPAESTPAVGTIAAAASTSATSTAGSVVGRVRLPAGGAGAVTRLSPYNRQSYGAALPQVPTLEMADVVVWVPSAPAPPAAGLPPRVAVDQRDMEIVPRVAVVSTGTTVDFPNSDDLFHNLFSLSSAKKFNLGRYAPGVSKSVTFDREGEVRVFCDIHSDMVGSILVVGTRAFARPAADGSYRIDGLTPGRHSIVVWHPALGADTVAVEVPDGAEVRLDLELR